MTDNKPMKKVIYSENNVPYVRVMSVEDVKKLEAQDNVMIHSARTIKEGEVVDTSLPNR